MVRTALAVAALLLLYGCAGTPPVSELRAGVRDIVGHRGPAI